MHAQAHEEARRQQLAALHAQRRAETLAALGRLAGEALQLARRAFAHAGFRRWAACLALAALPLFFTAFSLAQVGDDRSLIRFTEAHLRRDPTAASRRYWEPRRDEASDALVIHSASAALGALATVAAIGAGLFLTRRRSAAGARAASPSPGLPPWQAPAVWNPVSPPALPATPASGHPAPPPPEHARAGWHSAPPFGELTPPAWQPPPAPAGPLRAGGQPLPSPVGPPRAA